MTVKRIFQTLTLSLFIYLFLRAVYPLESSIPVDLFLLLDPLLSLVSTIASRAFTPGIIAGLFVVVTAVVFGRFFCAYVCPLGTFIDISDTTFFRKRLQPAFNRDKNWRLLKFGVFTGVTGAAAVGVILTQFFDPLVILTRFFSIIIYPVAIYFLNGLADLFRPFAAWLGWVGVSHFTYAQPVFRMIWPTFLIILGIFLLGFSLPRFWCRYLCPLGGFLALLARWSVIKRKVSHLCSGCGICQKSCPMGAIPVNCRQTIPGECILCRNCSVHCPERAVSFLPASKSTVAVQKPYSASLDSEEDAFNHIPSYLENKNRHEVAVNSPIQNPEAKDTPPKIQLSRRLFLSSVAGGMGAALLLRQDVESKVLKGNLIRPPGAIPEREYLSRCVRCGECLKVCLTNTLQPSFLEAGIEGMWTPRLEMRLAPCEQRCNLCGRVCPTGAIRPLELEERRHARIGTAVLRRDRCLVWEQDKLCLICDEICPYDAIEFRWVEKLKRPFVTESRCNGCGQCEYKCPVEGESAIIVVPMAEMRLKKGSYVEEAKRLKYEFREARKEEVSDQEKALFPSSISDAGEKSPPVQDSQTLPSGFIKSQEGK